MKIKLNISQSVYFQLNGGDECIANQTKFITHLKTSAKPSMDKLTIAQMELLLPHHH